MMGQGMSRHKLNGKPAAPGQNRGPWPRHAFQPLGIPRCPPCLSCPWAGTEAPGWRKEEHEKWCANLGVYGSRPHQVGDRGDGCRRRQTSFLMSLESWGHYWVGRQNYPPLCKSLRHPEAPLENGRHPTTEAWVFVFFLIFTLFHK